MAEVKAVELVESPTSASAKGGQDGGTGKEPDRKIRIKGAERMYLDPAHAQVGPDARFLWLSFHCVSSQTHPYLSARNEVITSR